MKRRLQLSLSSLLAGPRLLWAAWLLATPLPAVGHPQFALSTVNRYGKLFLGGSAAAGSSSGGRIFYTLMVGDVPANSLRKEADRDGNGELDDAEVGLLRDRLTAQVAKELQLSLDGQPLSPSWEPPLLALTDRRVGPYAFSFEQSGRLPFTIVAGRQQLLRYDDRVAVPPVGESELRLEEGPGAKIAAAWQGAAPKGDPERRLVFTASGPPLSSLSDRSVSIRFGAEGARAAGGSDGGVSATAATASYRRRGGLLLGLFGLLLTLVTGALVRRRRPQ